MAGIRHISPFIELRRFWVSWNRRIRKDILYIALIRDILITKKLSAFLSKIRQKADRTKMGGNANTWRILESNNQDLPVLQRFSDTETSVEGLPNRSMRSPYIITDLGTFRALPSLNTSIKPEKGSSLLHTILTIKL